MSIPACTWVLRDAFQLQFDRILNRGNINGAVVELGQRRIERRRLAGAGRPNHKDNSRGIAQHTPEGLQNRTRNHHAVETQQGAAAHATQQPHHHFFTILRRDGGEPEVDAGRAKRQ